MSELKILLKPTVKYFNRQKGGAVVHTVMTSNKTNYKDVYAWSTPLKIVGQPTLKTIEEKL